MIYSVKYNIACIVFLLLCTFCLYGQQVDKTPKMTINGIVSVGSKGTLSSKYSFVIQDSAKVSTLGRTLFYDNYKNDGSFVSQGKNAKSFFIKHDATSLELSGDAVSSFIDIVWDNATDQKAFDLKHNIEVYGQMEFENGIVHVDSTTSAKNRLSKGMITVFDSSESTGGNNLSYVRGKMEKIGNKTYEFPIGDKGFYRPLRIAASDCPNDAFLVEYSYKEDAFFQHNQKAVSVIEKINTQEYWRIEKSAKTKGPIILSLSLNPSTMQEILLSEQDYSNIHIVQWNERLGIWQDEGGVIDADDKYITALVNLRPKESVFALARVTKDKHLQGDVLVYNFVSANDDGKNEYLYVQNIHKYPDNSVEVYNRWGAKVFSTSNYDSYADGSHNVFNGHANTGLIVGQSKKLPSGTYYYIIRYTLQDKGGSKLISKSGNLHLETN